MTSFLECHTWWKEPEDLRRLFLSIPLAVDPSSFCMIIALFLCEISSFIASKTPMFGYFSRCPIVTRTQWSSLAIVFGMLETLSTYSFHSFLTIGWVVGAVRIKFEVSAGHITQHRCKYGARWQGCTDFRPGVSYINLTRKGRAKRLCTLLGLSKKD